MYTLMQDERSRNTEPDPSRPRTPAGRAFAEAAASEAEAMHRSVTESGGFTGSVTDAKPLSAGCVINHVGSCPTLPANASAANIRDCLTRNADWFTQDGNRHFGLWQDPDRGVLVLDRVTVAHDIEAATAIAMERKQRAFYDLATGTTHNL